ncbi:MAG: zinc ribbon domain-containing protein [Methanobrevibacter sp.]
MIRRCPQCGTASDDVYGFCIRCGYEYPKIPQDQSACPLCGYPNPDEADFCVKCGTPLLFKSQFEGAHTAVKPIIIKKEIAAEPAVTPKKTSRFIIYLGYILSILGSIIGLIIAIYLITRKDPNAKKHGYIQLAIIIFYIVLIAVLYSMGAIPPEIITQYRQLLAGNFTSI